MPRRDPRSPDDFAPPGEIHGPGGPGEHLPREEAPPVPPPPPGVEAFGEILTPGAGFVNPPDFEAEEAAPADDVERPASGHARGAARPIVREEPKVGRNAPCPCGSGRKYKKCCGK
jgi:hypothetical protein